MARLTLGLAAALGLAAGAAGAQVNLSSETAGQGGVPATVHAHLAEVAAARGLANFQIQYGQTLTNSAQNVAEGKSDIASAPQLLHFLMANARGPYSTLTPEQGKELAGNLRVLFTYSFGYFGLFAFDTVGLKGWEDLKGRKVYNGPPRGAALTQARQLIQLMGGGQDGVDYTGIQVNWNQDIATITDGTAEASVLPMTFPDRRVTAALASGRMTLFSATKAIFESEAFQRFATTPGTAPYRVPVEEMGMEEGVTVVTEDGIWRGTSTTGAEMVHKDMDFELAKALTAAFIATLPDLKAKVPWGNTVGLGVNTVPDSGLCGMATLKYHPGAIAAWEEAGYTIPDCAKP